MTRTVLIEFTADTEHRLKGARLRVDRGSAESFCDRLKVARRVDGSAPAAPAPVTPVPAPVDADEPAADPADVDDDQPDDDV